MKAETIARETGIPLKVAEKIRETKTATPEQRQQLYNLARRRQAQKLRDAGFSRDQRDALKSATPEVIARETHTRREWAEFIAQWYDRPVKYILKGMSKTKMTAEEFELYMRQRYPHAFNDEDIDEEEW